VAYKEYMKDIGHRWGYTMYEIPEKIRIDQLHFTSGFGGDYRIIAYSTKISGEDEEVIIENALIKYFYVTPDYPFKSSIRVFPLKRNFQAISIVTVAGKDELRRPGRQHAHILLIRNEYSRTFYIPLRFIVRFHTTFFSPGQIKPIELELWSFLKLIRNAVKDIEKDTLHVLDNKILDSKELATILSCIIEGIKTVIIPDTEKIELYDINGNGKPTSTNIIDIALYLLPASVRIRASFSSFSTHPAKEKFNVIFAPAINQEDNINRSMIIIDLLDRKIMNREGKRIRYKSVFIDAYYNLIEEAIKEGSFERVLLFSELLDRIFMISKYRDSLKSKMVEKIVKQIFKKS